MQIVINIEKKHFYAIVLVLCLMGGGLVYAYNTGSNGVPSQMGHSFDEVAGGAAVLGDVNCNPHAAGDCAGGTDIAGVTVIGTPVDGISLLDIYQVDVDSDPTASDGGALAVRGHASFIDGEVILSDLLQRDPGLSFGTHQLCIEKAISPKNGRIVIC